MIIELGSHGKRFAFQNDYFPAVWTTNLGGGRWRVQKTTNWTMSWKTISIYPGKDSGGRVQMEKPEGRGPWTNWLQTVQGVVGGNEARKSPEGRLGFYGLCNWVSSIAIYKSMGSKDKLSSLGETKYLQYTNSSPSFVLWGRKHRYYLQSLLKRVIFFCPISYATVWEGYYIPSSRVGKQGRQDPYVQQNLYSVGGKGSRRQISKQPIN